MRFKLSDLRLFIAVADTGSITGGADDVGLSLAAASERLRAMEASGKVRLLVRERRGVTPTEAGDALLHHARIILHQVSVMQGDIGELAGGVRSTVILLANTAATSELLPARIGTWLVDHPQADVDMKERQSSDIARSIARGFADIGVLSNAVDTTGLRLYPFAEDRLVAVASRDHFFAEMSSIRLSDLQGQPQIALTRGPLQEHINAHAAKVGVKLSPRIQVRGLADVCLLASVGAGVGIVPESAAVRYRPQEALTIKRLEEGWAVRELSLCVSRSHEISPLATSLLKHLQQQ